MVQIFPPFLKCCALYESWRQCVSKLSTLWHIDAMLVFSVDNVTSLKREERFERC